MPIDPVTAAALIQGGSQIVSGGLGSKGNRRAVQTQDAASRRAEAIAIDNEKRRREEYDRKEAMDRAQHDAVEARDAPFRAAREALLRQNSGRLGLSLGQLGGMASGGTGAPSATPARTLASFASSPYSTDKTLLTPSQDMSLGSVFNWNKGVA